MFTMDLYCRAATWRFIICIPEGLADGNAQIWACQKPFGRAGENQTRSPQTEAHRYGTQLFHTRDWVHAAAASHTTAAAATHTTATTAAEAARSTERTAGSVVAKNFLTKHFTTCTENHHWGTYHCVSDKVFWIQEWSQARQNKASSTGRETNERIIYEEWQTQVHGNFCQILCTDPSVFHAAHRRIHKKSEKQKGWLIETCVQENKVEGSSLQNNSSHRGVIMSLWLWTRGSWQLFKKFNIKHIIRWKLLDVCELGGGGGRGREEIFYFLECRNRYRLYHCCWQQFHPYLSL